MDDKMNAVIDIGNSRFKVGFFDNNQICWNVWDSFSSSFNVFSIK